MFAIVYYVHIWESIILKPGVLENVFRMQEFEITFDNHKFYTYSSQMFEMCLFLVFFLHQYKLERTFLGKSCLNY